MLRVKNLIKKFISPHFLNLYHFILAFLAAFFYRFPSKKIKVIGVTGTNGKTTTTEMISKIFEENSFKVALMNSIRFKIGEKEEKNMLKMTMPGRFRIQKFLREAVDSGCQYAILEVTSEGINQHRHRFIDFEVAVFTNLTPEHIEAHGSFEKYREAKGKLFKITKGTHIINADDPNAHYFLQFPAKKKILYQKYTGLTRTNLLGAFNLYNAAAAVQVGLSQGVDLETCKKALEKITLIPGRMEEVISRPFKVFVDYAFTPNALQKVYETLSGESKIQNSTKILSSERAGDGLPSPYSSTVAKSKMICVLGACGGGRDKWKRPVLGEIAAKYCDEIIVTNEDPYDEDPMEIIDQVAKGTGGKARKILDRRKAIRKSLELAKPNDTVIITGKGCEPWICVAGEKKIPWDDRQVVREEFSYLEENKNKLL